MQNKFSNFGFTNERGHRKWFIAEYRVTPPRCSSRRSVGICPTVRAGNCTPTAPCARTASGRFSTSQNIRRRTRARRCCPLCKQTCWRCRTLTRRRPNHQRNQNQQLSKVERHAQGGHSAHGNSGLFALHPNLPRKDSGWLLTKLHGRLAAPWTCLVVVFIAIPFGAARGGAIFSSAWRAAFLFASLFSWCNKSAWRWVQADICPRGWRHGCRI